MSSLLAGATSGHLDREVRAIIPQRSTRHLIISVAPRSSLSCGIDKMSLYLG